MSRFVWVILVLVAASIALVWWSRSTLFPPAPPERPTYSLAEIRRFRAAVRNAKPVLTASPAPLRSAAPVASSSEVPADFDGELARVRRWLDDDAACAYVEGRPAERAVEAAIWERVRYPEIRELFSERGPMKGELARGSSNPITDFFNALLYANLIAGVVSPQVDYGYAAELLSELERRDPTNGAVPFYRAYVLSLAGGSLDEQRAALARAFTAPGYTTYIVDIGNAIWTDAVTNPTAWIAAKQVVSTLPVPRLVPSGFIGTAFPDPTPEEAEFIVQFGLRLSSSEQAIPIERTRGTQIAQLYWSRARPNATPPELYRLQSAYSDTEEGVIAGLNQEPCSRTRLDRHFPRLRATPPFYAPENRSTPHAGGSDFHEGARPFDRQERLQLDSLREAVEKLPE